LGEVDSWKKKERAWMPKKERDIELDRNKKNSSYKKGWERKERLGQTKLIQKVNNFESKHFQNIRKHL